MIKRLVEEKYNLILALVLILFLAVRTPGLGRDISNTDAYRWHYRSQNFLSAIKSGNFKDTYQHYQPGVTLMWLNAFVKQSSFSIQYHLLGIDQPNTLENADFYPVIHGLSKLSIILVLTVVLYFQLKLVKELFGKEVSLWFGLLAALETYLIGIDRWMHLTSFEAYFGFLSFLYVLSWFKSGRQVNLAMSGLFLSLSVLSKITTLLTLPVYLFLILLKKEKTFKNFAIFGFSFLFTTFILFPALWTDPIFVFNKILKAMTGAVNSNFTQNNYSFLLGLAFYALLFMFKSSFTFLFGVSGFIVSAKKYLKNFNVRLILIYLGLYYAVLMVSGKKIDRYVIAMFPALMLLASLYLSDRSERIKKGIVFLSVAFFAGMSIVYYPVYSAYNSPLLGGSKTAIKLGVYDNSGEYFAQAAQYLNQKGREKKVYVPNGESSFFYFYKGDKTILREKADFVVVSHDFTRREIENFGCEKLEKSFGGDKDVVFVFSCR